MLDCMLICSQICCSCLKLIGRSHCQVHCCVHNSSTVGHTASRHRHLMTIAPASCIRSRFLFVSSQSLTQEARLLCLPNRGFVFRGAGPGVRTMSTGLRLIGTIANRILKIRYLILTGAIGGGITAQQVCCMGYSQVLS